MKIELNTNTILNHPKQPLSSWDYFLREGLENETVEDEETYGSYIHRCSIMWDEMTVKEKEKYTLKSEKDRKRYIRELKLYEGNFR